MQIRSAILLPELHLAPTQTTQPGLAVTLGVLPKHLTHGQHVSAGLEFSTNNILFTIPGTARYCVSNGTSITIEPQMVAAARDLRLYLLGTAFGIACHQQGLLPLHASAVSDGAGAYAFVGPSGSGKSTLAAWLARRGNSLLTDDICVVRLTADDAAIAHPGPPRIKLWNDTLEALNQDSSSLELDATRSDKFHLPVNCPATSGTPLKAIYVLSERSGHEASIGPRLQGFEALTALTNNTYREEILSALQLRERQFSSCARVARTTPVYMLQRPNQLQSLDAVSDVLGKHWSSL